jgi:hypothetical protein
MEMIPRTPPPSQANSFFGPGLSSFSRKQVGAIYHNGQENTMPNNRYCRERWQYVVSQCLIIYQMTLGHSLNKNKSSHLKHNN